jgi:large subunit ribosomal protein L21e
MAVRSKGLRSKSRNKLTKSPRERGRPPVTHSLREFPQGSRVAIKINPAILKGMPHIRFQGFTGVVQGRQGEAFDVLIHDGNKPKHLVVRPEHLKTVR